MNNAYSDKWNPSSKQKHFEEKNNFVVISAETWPITCEHILEKNLIVARSVEKSFPCPPLDHAHENTHWRKILLLPEMWKKIFRSMQFEDAHANPYWNKTILLPGVRKKIFTGRRPNHAHANTYWRKNLLLPGMWKTNSQSSTWPRICENTLETNLIVASPVLIVFPSPAAWPSTCEHTLEKNLIDARSVKKNFPVKPPDHAHANTYLRKIIMFPEVRKTNFGCWLLCFSCDNTHCIENHFVASRVEYSLTVHVTYRFMWNCSLCFYCGRWNHRCFISALHVTRNFTCGERDQYLRACRFI